MARHCTVCDSPHRVEIDRALVDGASRHAIARRYGLAETSVRRHAETHLPAGDVGSLRAGCDDPRAASCGVPSSGMGQRLPAAGRHAGRPSMNRPY